MNKKLQEKILAEIRNKVIEKDFERKNEQEINEMREANIEALTELTSLSRKEVETIADGVKKEFLIKQKQQQKRIITIGIAVISILFIGYLIFKPKPELKTRLVTDDFTSNSFEWSTYNSFNYNRYYKNNQYIIENNKSEWCYWDNIEIDFPKNYNVEISSSWQNGKFEGYGLSLLNSNSDYFAFVLKGDGAVSFGKVLDKKWSIDDPWKYDIANKGKKQTNIQRVEVRDKDFRYFVNDKLIRTGIIDLEIKNLAIRCCGEQTVAFDDLKVTNTDTKKVIFSEDFSKPSDQWNPEKDFLADSYLKNGKYIFNCNNEDNCYWSTSELHQVSDNCEIELSSTWLSGELGNYGLMVLNDDDNYYSFEFQNNGEARLVECKSDEYVFVQNYVKTGFESDGSQIVIQRLVIKDGKMSYFVNDTRIKTVPANLDFPSRIAMRICGKQSIAFENLSIKYFE